MSGQQLLVDVTGFANYTVGGGIHRVVRSVLREWAASPRDNLVLRPVVYRPGEGYASAVEKVSGLIGAGKPWLEDSPLEIGQGDVFFSLDLVYPRDEHHPRAIDLLQESGARVKYLVHDLLPLQRPDWFLDYIEDWHRRWMDQVARSDGAICVSRTVAADLQAWFANRGTGGETPPISWYHHGADFAPPGDGPRKLVFLNRWRLRRLQNSRIFLMVSTVEPRKGYGQALDAFESLWQAGSDAKLVIVGREGWLVDDLAHRMRAHPERNKRLFWFDKANDHLLNELYARATCLISASEGEGFGLPLIEAAQHGVPIIARDLPVFREVAGDNAFYFEGLSGDDLANAVGRWLALSATGSHPSSEGIGWYSWRESADQLLAEVLR